MTGKQELIKVYLDKTIDELNLFGDIVDSNKKNRAYDMFLDPEEDFDSIKKKIDEQKKKLLEEYKERLLGEQARIQKVIREQENRFQDKLEKAKTSIDSNIPIQIKQLDISTLSYDDLDKMLFHYTWDSNFFSINQNGLRATIGENSKGLDSQNSIFFSKGIEGVLQTWDVWLKWRLNRLNNPYSQDYINKELFIKGDASKEKYFEYEAWKRKFLSGEYKKDASILKVLFEYQYIELMHSNYFSLDLKEGIDYLNDQVDHKKDRAFREKNSIFYDFLRTEYGDYSNLESSIVDKWNMQTIPGKDIVVLPINMTQLITNNGDTDVMHVLINLYDFYKKSVTEDKQTKFDLLDNFINYSKKKDKEHSNYNRTSEITVQSLLDEGIARKQYTERKGVTLSENRDKVITLNKSSNCGRSSNGFINVFILIIICVIILIIGIFILNYFVWR